MTNKDKKQEIPSEINRPLSDKISDMSILIGDGFISIDAIRTKDIKQSIKELKEELHNKSKTEKIFHCEQCKELVWEIINEIFGPKLT